MKQPPILQKWETVLSVTCIILLAILAYFLLAGQLGYYRDDWYMIWAAKTGGMGRLFQMFKIDRPFMGLVSGISYWLVGDSILAWQFYALVLRILSGLGFLWLIRLLWPSRKIATLSMAAVFIVYPGFFQQTNALTFSNHFISYALSIYSVVFTIVAYRQEKWVWKWLLIGLSMMTAMAYMLIYEYMIGMEVVRVLLLGYLHFQTGVHKFWKIAKLTIKQWLPSIFPLIVFLVWRLFIFSSTRYATDIGRLGKLYIQDPFGMGLRLIVEVFRDFIETAYLAWFVPLYRLTSQASINTLLIGLIAAGIGSTIVAILWYVLKDKSDEVPNIKNTEDHSWYRELLIIGSLWILCTIFPVVLSERQVLFQTMLDRYTLHVTAGVAVLLIGNIYVLFSDQRLRFGFVALLVGIGIFTNFHNAVDFAKFWNYQRDAWWQLSWRAPGLKNDTSITLILPTQYRLAEGYETWAPANLIYQEDPNKLLIAGEVLNLETLTLINQPTTIERNMRSIIVTSDFKNSLVMSLNNGGCLHIYDGSWLGFPENEEPMIQMIAKNSNIDLIETFRSTKQPSEEIFGSEPQHKWCYYYQKAGLASQKGDWEEVSRLGNEATQLGLEPDSGYEMEWMPFYEGYLRIQEVDKAEILSKKIRASSAFIISFCNQNKVYITDLAQDEIRAGIVRAFCYDGDQQ